MAAHIQIAAGDEPEVSASVPTLADVARHAGVSLATASRALNGSTRTVNPELKAKVEASARQLHYTANAQAQAVARGTSRTVALVLGDIADPYFSAIAAGVADAAARHRLVVTMSTAGTDPDHVVETIAALRGQRPTAVIVVGSRYVDDATEAAIADELRAVEGQGGSVALIGARANGFRAVPVLNDEGASDLAQALVGLGYRDFAVLAGPAGLTTAADRARGFRDGLARHSIRLGDASFVTGGFTRNAGYRDMGALLDAGIRPECVFAVTDVMAVGAMTAMRERGLTPGADIAVAGFDDIEMLQDVVPSLTTVSLPLRELGERSLELALAEVPPELEPFRGEVTLRDSTPSRV
ncbi:LacI family DNA-binding transcriptional regulator [Rathayibacter sp. KR2-224]|uniref:LacI family DNA-binding transcriptional regulator n=1 Tax=Rathayibacter sp. KR2-224 TaxID=3400913 RepID=UPI003C07107B